MTPEAFTYWLKGFFELTETDAPLSARQILIIRDHLDLVFNKVTPDRTESTKVSPLKIDVEKILDDMKREYPLSQYQPFKPHRFPSDVAPAWPHPPSIMC